MRLNSAAAVLALIFLTCSPGTIRRLEFEPIEQKVIFQHSHLSDIWDNQYKGWFIDNEGYLRAYDVIENERENWYPLEESGPDSGYISRTALLADYRLADQVIYWIPPLELHKYYGFLKEAASGENSELVRVGTEEPISRMVGYVWNEERGKYRAVLISLSGDWSQYNISPEAERIEDWLAGLDRIYVDSLAEWFRGVSAEPGHK